MDRNTLTEEAKKEGGKALKAFDDAGIIITASLWLWDINSNRWALIMATPLIDREGPKSAYAKLRIKLPANSNVGIDSISLVSPQHPLISLLRIAIQTEPNAIGSIDFIGNTINNTYIEAAYIYRIT